MISGVETIWARSAVLLQAGPPIDIAAGAEQGAGAGFILDILLGLLLLAGIIGAGYFIAQLYRAKSKSPAHKLSPVQILSPDLRARVDKALQRHEYEVAGDMLAHAGVHDDAAEAYAQGGAYAKAAQNFHASGNRAQAIFFYKQAGEFEQSARLYAENGEFRAAAAEFVQAENFAAAAEQYERGEDHHRAGEYFERAGDLLRAALSFERAQELQRAAGCYQRFVDLRALEESSGGDREGALSVLGDERGREAARRAAKLHQRLGEPERAAELFYRAGELRLAAANLRELGDYARAASWLLEAGDPAQAAEALEEGGEAERAAKMRAQAALRGGDKQKAARMFEAAGEFERAAEFYVELGELGRAAPLFESVGAYIEAAELYHALGKYGREARCAEEAGKLTRAADAYRAAGDVESEIRVRTLQEDFFRAGRLLFEHRRFAEALEVLRHIDSADPIYLRALELAGDVYRAQGRFEKAYSRYKSALGQRVIDVSTLPLVYKMARALEEEKDLGGALEHYNELASVDAEFEDVPARIQLLNQRLRRGSLSGRSSGLFAAAVDPQGELPRRYEIIEEVARGGMGVVYKARDTVLGRIVAYKILGENLKDNEVAVRYFLREARAAAALSHPNIVTIYDAGEQNGDYYMAMEFVEGTTLKQLIEKKGALAEKQARYVLNYCCRALDYAHSRGVVHRDIKSGNVMLTLDRSLKIMDFGLAKFLREYQNNHTQQVGTPFYMSPEQVVGESVDFRSDLYSLGCTLFECATGKVPFYKGDLSYHHLHTPPPRPRDLNPKLSAELERIILKLLVKNPDDRYQSAQEVLDELGELV